MSVQIVLAQTNDQQDFRAAVNWMLEDPSMASIVGAAFEDGIGTIEVRLSATDPRIGDFAAHFSARPGWSVTTSD